MARYYRYRLPPWCRNTIIVIENCTLPLFIFQLIRTIILPTSFDVLLSIFLAGLFISFYLKWI
ncbi:hypothetical protein ACFSTA_11400 [Ornithinibacillus salinisoli]|uniref:Uncharacterized protein n=1 Tax=Ornithinibacillus salinisoli TaxID=1848459 RepID=A0ABW4W5Z7_9BACI